MEIKLFIVDDDIELTSEIASLLKDEQYEVGTANSLSIARKKWPEFKPDIMLLDLRLPDGLGLELISEIKSQSPETMVVMLSGYGTISNAVEAIKKGAEDFLAKPVDPDYLLLFLQKLIEQKNLRNKTQVYELEIARERKTIIGSSRKMQEALNTCTTAAKSEATLLLTGETGTGKHLFAHFIHQKSAHCKFPFVYVNCATLGETLLESDLFGHEKGAFTGAHQQKKGRAELAHHGSLFLDEIGEIPPKLQAKLLHFIESGEFQRVGGTKTLYSNARIICATNRDLAAEVTAGKFREDLYYRINVIQIPIPPLRERTGDIPILATHFLEKYKRDLGRTQLAIDEVLLNKLSAYSWPGNVRELQNAIERAVVLCPSNYLQENDFPFLSTPSAATSDKLFLARPLSSALNDFKKQFLAAVLKQTVGNQKKAAEILEIQRTYLNRLIKELGLNQ